MHHCCCFPLCNKIHQKWWCPKQNPSSRQPELLFLWLVLTAESLFAHLPFYYAYVLWDRPIAPSSEGTSTPPPLVLTQSCTCTIGKEDHCTKGNAHALPYTNTPLHAFLLLTSDYTLPTASVYQLGREGESRTTPLATLFPPYICFVIPSRVKDEQLDQDHMGNPVAERGLTRQLLQMPC